MFALLNGHAGAGLGIFMLIGLALVIGAMYVTVRLMLRFGGSDGLKYAGGFGAVAIVLQLLMVVASDSVIAQSLASLTALPWSVPLGTFFREDSASSLPAVIFIGSCLNAISIFIGVGMAKELFRKTRPKPNP